jgi:hypothetical protein
MGRKIITYVKDMRGHGRGIFKSTVPNVTSHGTTIPKADSRISPKNKQAGKRYYDTNQAHPPTQ